MTDNYDQLALSWVRKEINNTLDQARQGLENFAGDTQDQTQIQFCINCLHQVQGTLQMLEFSGAAQLVAEMESLADKMSTDPSLAIEASFEVLMRALLQIPGYLERVEEGQKDIPVILLPLINEVRAASNSAPMSEHELFSADTTSVLPPKAVEKVSEKDKTTAFQDNAKKLRAHYQKGLTGVIRGEKIKECLARIHKVLLRLEALTEGHPVSRLWWVADGFIFAVSEGGLYKRKEAHMLLSQVDKQIKRLSDVGAAAMDDVIPEKLLSQLLYFVARSNSKNERIAALKQEFNLASYLSDSEQIKKRQQKLSRPDSSAVTNVVGAINEELASVKDQLDLFVRSPNKDTGKMQAMVDSLIRIADTLTLLELAIPRDVIRQQVKSIQKLVDLNKVPDDSLVMDVAGALLFVEANLKNVNLEAEQEITDETEATERSQVHAKESQVDDATQTLIKVARKSMQNAKDKMINYIASGFESEALEDVPGLLEEVLGAVKIVQFDAAAEILGVAKEFVEERIIGATLQPDEEYLDALADVITSVEYYLEASEEGKHKGVSSILKGAEKSVARLKAILAEAPKTAKIIEVPQQPSKPDSIASEQPKEENQEASLEFELPADDATADSETNDTSVPEPVVQHKPVEAKVVPIVASADKEVDETLIDEEVLEIFLEEAEEEIQAIEEMLPRWVNNLQDEEALTTLRRSFHTLKGSGRLVGAKKIGEFSWAIENMLNKVIEESVPAEMPVTSTLNEAFSMLPQLVENFSNRTPITCDYEKVIAKAEHISSGKSLSDFDYETPKTESVAEATTSQKAEASVEAIDPILLEIFSAEAETHLQSISNFISEAPADGSVAITDDLIRALHTLKGSANMANVGLIASITGPLEKHARLAKGSNQRFDQATMKLIANVHQALVESLSRLKANETVENDEVAEIIKAVESLQVANLVGGESSGKQRDQQFVSIFLTEGLDILHEVSKLNEKLEANLADANVIESIRSELHTFHRGAEMVAIDELEKLSASCEKLASSASSRTTIEPSFNILLIECVDGLSAMLNKIASEEDISLPNALLEKIDLWIEGPESDEPPEDMDVELVELFVEEGEELVESARELVARWKDNLNSKELNSELRRIYHTFKGSSRMAGAMTVGDLGYAVEDIFNTVIEFGRQLTQVDYQLVETSTDKLESMVAELKRLRWPGSAEREVNLIRNHLAGKPVEIESVDDAIESSPVDVLETSTSTELPEVETVELEISEIEESTPDDNTGLEVEAIEVADVDEPLEFEIEESAEPESLELDSSEPEKEDSFTLDVESETADEELEIEDTPTVEDELTIEESVDEIPTLEVEEEIEIEALEPSQAQSETSEDDLGELVLTDIEDAEVDEDASEEIEIPSLTDFVDDAEIAADSGVEEEEIEATQVGEAQPEELEEQKLENEAAKLAEIDSDIEDVEDSALELPETQVEETESNEESETSEDAQIPELEVEETVSEENIPEEVKFEEVKQPAYEQSRSESTISPSAPVIVSGNVQTVDLDEDGEEVLEIYLEEAEELLVNLDEALHEWSESLDNKSAIDLLQRTLHTFKGGARLSDLVVLGDLTHEMETYFEKVTSGELKPKAADVGFLLQGYDVIASLIKEVTEERKMTVPVAYMQALDDLISGKAPVIVDAEEATEEPAVIEGELVTADEEMPVADVLSFEKKKQEQEAKKTPQSTEVVRLPAEQLEGLVNLAGETSIFRSRLEQQMSVLKYNLEEMNSTIERLKDQLRNLDIETEAQILYRREISGGMEYDDFDPLEMDRYTRQQELTRGLGESAVDLVSLKETLDALTSDSETLLLQQGRVNTEMQESLMRTRMTPFESLVPRLRRMVRQISTELGKTIELSISAEGEMDRTVLERMIAPLEHMLRNAMDHGIEPPQERKANQKPETGSVRISLYREGSEVFVKIQDDGRGLNLKAIRKKATEKGLISENSELSDHELQQLILEAGFSTAEQVTQISGRGVGMDVVSSEIKQMGGVIEIDSTQGVGTTFTVKLPFTVSVNHALMVQLGDEVFAIPLSNIEGIVRVSPFELEEYYSNEDADFEYAGINYSMNYLGQLLDHNRTANLKGVVQPLPVLLLHGADHPTALQVDELLGSREIVVKSLGSQLSSISGLSGATILGDGRVVLILDMPALIRRIDATIITDDSASVFEAEDKVPVVMVVDDSITVRKVTTRLLERHNFEVITAKDGVDALTVLGEQKPDVMLLDIEMPRMDGFELATIIRHDDGLKDLPIIMITSRTGEKHRERAEQIGVNQYMGKPYNEVDLLDTISSLLPSKA